MQVRELIQIKIESLNYSANAVGKYDEFVVFVPYGVPGDTLLVRITEIKRNYAIGELVEIIQPSQYRCNPPCQHFVEGCGGCQWQHIVYEYQLEWKKDIIIQALKRIGKLGNIPEIKVYSLDNPLHYRNKLRLFSLDKSDKMLIGMRKYNTNNTVPIKECLISNDKINDIIKQLQRELISADNLIDEMGIRSASNNQIMLTCSYSKNNRSTKAIINHLKSLPNISSLYSIINDSLHLENGKPTIVENVSNRSYEISSDSFFQVNLCGLEYIIEIVKECLGSDNKIIYDAHCGVGTFALQMADHCGKVWGTDISSSVIELASQNAVNNDIHNAFFRKGSAIRILNSKLDNEKLDAVILDPPRNGCDRLDLQAIIQSKPNKIIYVSCNPTTLARDLHEINKAGYELIRIAMVDMFPMTYHLETIAFCVSK